MMAVGLVLVSTISFPGGGSLPWKTLAGTTISAASSVP